MSDLTARHLARLKLGTERRWYRGPVVGHGVHGMLYDQRVLRILAAEQRRKDGRRIWWPKEAGISCSSRHGFSREPIAQREGNLFNRRPGRREAVVPFRRCCLDYDLPF